MVGVSINAGVGRRNEKHLIADLGAFAVLGHESKRGSLIAANRIAGDGDAVAICAELARVLGKPLQCSIAFLQLRWKFCRREGSIFNEHANLAGAHDEVAQQALMILKIADDPNAAVYEEQEAGRSTHMLRLHDVEFNRAAILC